MTYDAKLLILSLLTATALACGDDTSSEGTGPADSGSTTEASATAGSATDTTDATNVDTSSGAAETSEADTTAGSCTAEQPSIVTDIDETLTLSDGEFLMQIGDGTYDPIAREGAVELVNAYADLGYHVLYLTARSETIVLKGTGETAREATERWIDEHGFPNDPATTTVTLAPKFLFGDDTQIYKAQALMDEQAGGRRFDYAYGNATTDIGAYAEAGIALDATFIIGENAGEGGTVAVMGEGWLEHNDSHLPSVPAVCEAGG